MLNLFESRRCGRMWTAVGLACAAAMPLALTDFATAQSTQRAAFVGNNGNIEGAVTSFTFDSAGVPQLVQHLVLGSGSGNTANNVYALALSPDGRYLATTHATGATPRLIHIIRINEDATMTLVDSWPTPPTPLDAAWIDNEFLAVTESNSSSADSRVIVYRYDRVHENLSEIGRSVVGPFSSSIAVHPSGDFLYAENGGLSGATWISVFQIGLEGALTNIHTEYTSSYMLGLGISPNGRWLYGGGGISSGSNVIGAYNIDETTGFLSWMPGSPFISPGTSPSPKQVVVNPHNTLAFVGHGRSAEVRSFSIEPTTGALTDTGHVFKVGGTGDLGNIAVLDDLVLFTRQYGSSMHGPAGLLSFTAEPDGALTLNGHISTGSTRPFDVVAWSPPAAPPCYANCDGSTTEPILTVDDFTCFINEFASAQALPPAQQVTHYANCDGNTTEPILTVDDFTCFINEFSQGCP